ncbi:hypothetical protein GQY15_11850 [Rhodobacter sphaeroides]|nr:hypothetical protein [Cereibacter sphaeroides]
MVSRPRHGLSLCAGGGGLDLGLMLAEPDYHTRAFVEWEDWPRTVLVAAQRAGYFAPAPIWTDLRSFDARPFRGAFDAVLAGYPCQPFSAAGKRGGADDPRHIWPDVARVIGECRPDWVFLENVAGHVTLGLDTVLRELWGLPVRQPGGIEALRPFLNTASEDDFRMMVAWLLGCFHPRGPYPILILTGEQGSAKSTTAKVLRSLIDPANPMARSAPQSEQDLVIAARHNHVLAFDNLSTVKPALADALCRIATGGGFGTRKLHTDSDEALFTATRPILLNGIPDLASRPDLADRAIILHLPVIEAGARQFEAEFWKALDRAAPGILAALLDATSCALARIGSVSLAERPRMADFAKRITAAEPALGWPQGAFLDAYTRNRQSTQAAALDGNPLAEAIIALVTQHGPWQGTATELLKILRQTAPALTADPLTFPRYANQLTSALRRVQPLLRDRNVIVTQDRESGTGQRVIRLQCR